MGEGWKNIDEILWEKEGKYGVLFTGQFMKHF
jgi:hypothetical protein